MGFQSLFIGATGLKAHGQRMNTLGNNIANVNTLGFKGTESFFENLMSDQVVSDTSYEVGLAQQGHGVRLGALLTDFTQGAAIQGSASTDLSISGKGFFQVAKDGLTHYTRAGNFRFDNQGYLVDPNGFRVQGRAFPTSGAAGSGGLGDIQLNMETGEDGFQYMTMDPQATTEVAMSANLGAVDDKTSVAANPFFSLLTAWDGTADQPLGQDAYSLTNTIKVYDEEGDSHSLSVYFDLVNTGNGRSHWEYVVGMPPSDEGRAGWAGASSAGLLMAGTLSFLSSGELYDMSAYTASGPDKGLSNWAPAAINAEGMASFDVSFATSGGGTALQTIGLTFGVTGSGWQSGDSAAAVGSNASNLNGFGQPSPSPFSSTNYAGTSSVLFQDQDGYPPGYLESVDVDTYGVMVGNYSNGLDNELYQIALFTFTNQYGLRREGNNHFAATAASGQPLEGSPRDYDAVAGTNDDALGMGLIMNNSIENSNVDLAEQFAHMIVTERGFQANSKIVTTTDWLLQQAAALKR
jgi:flagellar hook protein FlgE